MLKKNFYILFILVLIFSNNVKSQNLYDKVLNIIPQRKHDTNNLIVNINMSYFIVLEGNLILKKLETKIKKEQNETYKKILINQFDTINYYINNKKIYYDLMHKFPFSYTDFILKKPIIISSDFEIIKYKNSFRNFNICIQPKSFKSNKIHRKNRTRACILWVYLWNL